VLYGIELMRPDRKTISLVRRWAVQAGHIKPMGVPTELRLLAGGTYSDPGFLINKMPLYRMAREFWLRQHSDPVPQDCLSVEELRRAMFAVHGHITGTHQMYNGVLFAVAETMKEWGGRFVGPVNGVTTAERSSMLR